MKLASWPWPIVAALSAGVLLGAGLSWWVNRKRQPAAWTPRPTWTPAFPRFGEFLRLLATDGGHLLIGLGLIIWGTFSMLFGDSGKAIGIDIVKLTLGGLLAIIKPGGVAIQARGRFMMTCPFCKKEFDPRQGSNAKPDDPDG